MITPKEIADDKKRRELIMATMPAAKNMAWERTEAFRELPAQDSIDGASEIAKLTAWRSAQEFAFEPVMQALLSLRKLTWDPKRKFMIINDARRIDWMKVQRRSYASFEEFYSLELESTWGKWSELERDWSEVVRGTKTAEQVEERVLGQHGGARPILDDNEQGSDATLKDNEPEHVGRGAAYWLARLRRDGHDDLADRVAAKEISARAAAIEAGIITPPTPLTLLRRAWNKASDEEREIFLAEVT